MRSTRTATISIVILHLPNLGCDCGMMFSDENVYFSTETGGYDDGWGNSDTSADTAGWTTSDTADGGITTDGGDTADAGDTTDTADSGADMLDGGDSDDGADTSETGDPTGADGDCHAPAHYVDCDGSPGALTQDPWQAIGIGCPGNESETIPAQTVMVSNNPDAWRVASYFGSASGVNENYDGNPNFGGKLWAPNSGAWTSPSLDAIPSNTSSALLIISTGVVAPTDAQGGVLETTPQTENGENGNLDDPGLPPPLSSALGSNNGLGGTPFMDCDLVNDCSDSLFEWWNVKGWNTPNDAMWMRATLTVPPGTSGFLFDFAYFSSEWPDYYGTRFNDQFIAWSTSEAYTGNLTFVNDAPLTITSLADAGAFVFTGDAPELEDTGFSGNAATSWFVARGPAEPDETFDLIFYLADLGDGEMATNVLIDNFRWECAGCVPNEVDSCGMQPPM